ncbi:hypothetical protein HY256_02525 [Candidatus Sumerlaeota bacterium]|nr:hypothetical protein [Candidatus Sumerlaeota bacterium]
MPVAPFVLLLAGDAMAHWDFDGKAGMLFRGLMRFTRWSAILLGIPVSILLASDIGLGLSIGLAVACFIFMFHRSRTTHVYALWERTMQGAWFLVVVFLCVEFIYVRDYLPRRNFLSRHRAFTAQIKTHLPEHPRLFLYGEDSAALYSYALGDVLPITRRVADLAKEADDNTYLLSDSEVKDLMDHPDLAAVVTKHSGDKKRARAALFKVMRGGNAPTTPSLTARYLEAPPIRVAVLGDPAASPEGEKDVAQRIAKLDFRAPFHEAIVIGNFLHGESLFDRIEFEKSFERPVKKFLKEGLPFHGVIGPKDAGIAPFVTRYTLLQMGKERYYARDFQGGLVRFYALDSVHLEGTHGEAGRQLKWLKEDLKSTQALWRIAAIAEPPLISEGGNTASANGLLAERLPPLLDANNVQLVLWAGKPCYERIEDPAHKPVFIGTGWSGETKRSPPSSDSRIKLHFDGQPGFVTLDINPARIKFLAVTADGDLVDGGFIGPAGGEIQMPEDLKGPEFSRTVQPALDSGQTSKIN